MLMRSRNFSAVLMCAVLGGPALGQTLLFRADGKAQGDRYAESVGSAGDFNRDGYDDFIVGGKFDDSNGVNAGIALDHHAQRRELAWLAHRGR